MDNLHFCAVAQEIIRAGIEDYVAVVSENRFGFPTNGRPGPHNDGRHKSSNMWRATYS
jgi:hypothetical protein